MIRKFLNQLKEKATLKLLWTVPFWIFTFLYQDEMAKIWHPFFAEHKFAVVSAIVVVVGVLALVMVKPKVQRNRQAISYLTNLPPETYLITLKGLTPSKTQTDAVDKIKLLTGNYKHVLITGPSNGWKTTTAILFLNGSEKKRIYVPEAEGDDPIVSSNKGNDKNYVFIDNVNRWNTPERVEQLSRLFDEFSNRNQKFVVVATCDDEYLFDIPVGDHLRFSYVNIKLTPYEREQTFNLNKLKGLKRLYGNLSEGQVAILKTLKTLDYFGINKTVKGCRKEEVIDLTENIFWKPQTALAYDWSKDLSILEQHGFIRSVNYGTSTKPNTYLISQDEHIFKHSIIYHPSDDILLPQKLIAVLAKRGSSSSGSFFHLGYSFSSKGYFSYAETCYKYATSFYKSYSSAYYCWGNLLIQTAEKKDRLRAFEDYGEAVRKFTQAIALNGSVKNAAYLGLGHCFFNMAKIVNDPTKEPLLLKKAEEAYRKVLPHYGNRGKVQISLAEIYAQSGNTTKAEYYYNQAVDIDNSGKANCSYARFLVGRGNRMVDTYLANQVYIQARDQFTTSIGKNYAPAHKDLAKFLNDIAHKWGSFQVKGVLLDKQALFKESEKHYLIAIEELNNNGSDWRISLVNLGRLYTTMERFEKARKYIKTALDNDPLYGEAYNALFCAVNCFGESLYQKVISRFMDKVNNVKEIDSQSKIERELDEILEEYHHSKTKLEYNKALEKAKKLGRREVAPVYYDVLRFVNEKMAQGNLNHSFLVDNFLTVSGLGDYAYCNERVGNYKLAREAWKRAWQRCSYSVEPLSQDKREGRESLKGYMTHIRSVGKKEIEYDINFSEDVEIILQIISLEKSLLEERDINISIGGVIDALQYFVKHQTISCGQLEEYICKIKSLDSISGLYSKACKVLGMLFEHKGDAEKEELIKIEYYQKAEAEFSEAWKELNFGISPSIIKHICVIKGKIALVKVDSINDVRKYFEHSIEKLKDKNYIDIYLKYASFLKGSILTKEYLIKACQAVRIAERILVVDEVKIKSQRGEEDFVELELELNELKKTLSCGDSN